MPIGAAFPQVSRHPRRLSGTVLMPLRRAWDHATAGAARGGSSAADTDMPAQGLAGQSSCPDPTRRQTRQNTLPAALEIRGLAKQFGRPAVNGLHLSVPAGQFYALLGPNGAGKTTTMRMVTGLLQPDHGAITVFGIDALADPIGAKRIMAWVADEPMVYDKLTPMEYLAFVAGLWTISRDLAAQRAQALLAAFGLQPQAHDRCEGLSKGMRQKVALAGALVHDPRLILLDEPLTGLDAASARLVKQILRERVSAGCTVIMTTHILEVAERMADRIGVMAGGRLIAEGTLDELRCLAGSGHASLEDTFLALVAQGAAAE